MELGSKVTVLEEEIGVLKGEIKTILQEVRTAVLARENPFAMDSSESSQMPAQTEVPPPASEALPSAAETPPVLESPQPEAPPKVVQLHSVTEAGDPEIPTIAPFPGRDETDAARPIKGEPPARRRWSIGSLATLIAWTQETAARMDASDLDIVLSLARYGGLIDEELESTLTKLSTPLLTRTSSRVKRA